MGRSFDLKYPKAQVDSAQMVFPTQRDTLANILSVIMDK